MVKKPYSIIYLRDEVEVETVSGPLSFSKAKIQALEQFPAMQANQGATRVLIRDDADRAVFSHPRTTLHPYGTR